jgi:hypothetical protein
MTSSLDKIAPLLASWTNKESLVCLVFFGSVGHDAAFLRGRMVSPAKAADALVTISSCTDSGVSISFDLAGSLGWTRISTEDMPPRARKLLEEESVEEAFSFRFASGGRVLLARLKTEFD